MVEKAGSIWRRLIPVIGIAVCGLALTGCSSFKDAAGFTKRPPDETQVATNRPLAMPPDYGLRPPTDAPAPLRVDNTPLPVDNSRAQPLRHVKPPQQTSATTSQQPPAPIDNSRPQPLRHSYKDRQPAQRVVANTPQQQPGPVQLGSATPQPNGTNQQVAATPKKRMTAAEYEAHVAKMRKDKLAQEKARNPNYGTWKNLWNVFWE